MSYPQGLCHSFKGYALSTSLLFQNHQALWNTGRISALNEDRYYCCCLVAQSCPILCNPMNSSTPGFPVLHHLPKFAQTQVHWVGDAIQLPHPLLSLSPPALSLSQHQGLFWWVSSLHQLARVLELQLQHQSFQWIQGWFPLRLTGLISLLS